MAYGETPVVKGALLRLSGGDIEQRVDFQFNPTEFEEVFSTKWKFSAGDGQFLPAVQFVKFEPTPMQLELFISGREDGSDSAERRVARLKLFALPGSKFGPGNMRGVSPGRARFVWGRRAIPVVVTEVRVTHMAFSRKLRTTIAKVQIQLTVISEGIGSELAYLDEVRGRST